jgi:hypothetical protein
MTFDSITHVMIVLKPYLLLDFEEGINIIFEQSIRVLGRKCQTSSILTSL